MSVADAFDRLDENAEAAARRVWLALVGDRLGAVLLLVSGCWFGLLWRAGFLSTDQYVYANVVAALADGHLAVRSATYGPSLALPGMHVRDGLAYGRNYGIAVAALPFHYLYRSLAVVVSLRVAALGAWVLGLLALARTAGAAVGRRELGTALGAGAAVALFLSGLLVAEPLAPRWTPVLALTTVTVLAGGVTAVLLYRLVARLHGKRVGFATGLAAALASPVGFWALFPKRHALTALAVVAVLYLLQRSRATAAADGGTGSGLRFRAGAYAVVPLLAWAHAAEALLLGVALLAVDLPTAPRRDPRALATVAGAGLVAAVPFLLTNLFVSGSPFVPPRMLPSYTADVASAAASSGGGGGAGSAGGASASTNGGSSAGSVAALGAALPAPVAAIWEVLVPSFVESATVFGQPGRLFTVFVRHGYVPLTPGQDVAVNLSVLASMPLLGALAAGPALAVRRYRDGERPLAGTNVLDAFAVLTAVLFVGLFLGRLPLHHMLTARYLHPLYPLGAYGLARLPPVRRAVRRGGGKPLVLAYGLTVPAATVLHIGAIAALRTTLGEAVQLYALTAVGVGGLVAVWGGFAGGLRPGADEGARVRVVEAVDRAGPVLLGVAAGLFTAYLLVGSLSLFPVGGRHLLPPVRAAAEVLAVDSLVELGTALLTA